VRKPFATEAPPDYGLHGPVTLQVPFSFPVTDTLSGLILCEIDGNEITIGHGMDAPSFID